MRRTDHGVELGGITDNQNTTYTRRLWSDYHNRFGKDDSYGFSIAVYPGRMAEMLRNFDASGGRPSATAVPYNPLSCSWVSSRLSSRLYVQLH